MNYRLTPAAVQDITEIWEYIAVDNPRAADRLEQRFFDTFALLAALPRSGHQRPDWTDKPVLFFPVRRYLIVYRDTQPLEIVRVLHGARNIPEVLQGT